jgi:Derlin-2/3
MTDINTWFYSLPPVTRNYLAATSVITILVSLNVFSPYSVVFISDEVIKHFQVWRIFTAFGFFGKFGFNWLFDMAFL